MVLAGNADQINNLPEVKSLKEQLKSNTKLAKQLIANADIFNKNAKPVRTIKALINGKQSLVQVYADGSFTVASLSDLKYTPSKTVSLNVATQSKSSQSTITPDTTSEIWSQTVTGYGSHQLQAVYNCYVIYLVQHLVLTVDFNIGSDVSISSASTAGTYCVYPDVLNSTSGTIGSNNSTFVSAEGDYTVQVWYGVYPGATFTNSIDMYINQGQSGNQTVIATAWANIS